MQLVLPVLVSVQVFILSLKSNNIIKHSEKEEKETGFNSVLSH